jgi:hypothetical protein
MEFDRQWRKPGIDDNEFRQMQAALLHNSKTENVIQGTKRLRKTRIAVEGAGKSGSGKIVRLKQYLKG